MPASQQRCPSIANLVKWTAASLMAGVLLVTLSGSVAPDSWSSPVSCRQGLSAATDQLAVPPQLARVFAALQGDIQVYVFNGPELRLVVSSTSSAMSAEPAKGVIRVGEEFVRRPWSDDELYAMLAHEAFHVVHRDGLSEPCTVLLPSPALRAQETRADYEAKALLIASGRDPAALENALLKLQLTEGEIVEESTHPRYSARIMNLERHSGPAAAFPTRRPSPF